ncbi:unnamed protein product [Gulo gulo]|uniref:60S ribosomal protein L32 n=1 Tax=Gulo gulo TaxID=48420 RepID=A0A9X9LYQ7_GULGU|nr:unnamed protein product [Gulo gulo]
MPSIGYRSNKKTKHMLPSGFRKFLAHKAKELDGPLVCNSSDRAEMTHKVSSKNHRVIVERAPSWPLESPIPMPGCAAKKMNRRIAYVHILVVLIKSENYKKNYMSCLNWKLTSIPETAFGKLGYYLYFPVLPAVNRG